MSESAINLLLQIPLAGVVVFVVVLFLKFLEKMFAQFMAFIKEQREANNAAIVRVSDTNNAAVLRLADEIKHMAARIDKVEEALTRRAPKTPKLDK